MLPENTREWASKDGLGEVECVNEKRRQIEKCEPSARSTAWQRKRPFQGRLTRVNGEDLGDSLLVEILMDTRTRVSI